MNTDFMMKPNVRGDIRGKFDMLKDNRITDLPLSLCCKN